MVRAYRTPPERPQQHWGNVLHLQVSPVLLPDARQVVRVVRCPEPRLLVYFRPVVMYSIDKLVWLRQLHGELPGSLQVAPPPVVVAMVLLDSLNDNQPIRIDCQDGVACPLSSQPPVRARIAIAPGCRAAWLIG